MMKLDFNKRLKDFLIQLVIREGDADAWENFKGLKPDIDELDTVILNSRFYDEAWDLFVELNPGNEDILHIVKHSKEKRNEAANLLLKQEALSPETLAELVENAHSDEAARRLLAQHPAKEILLDILRCTNLKEEAAKQLLSQTLENDELIDILTERGAGIEAWERLLNQNPTNKELISLVEYSDLQEEAWEQLLKQNPTNEELMDFVNDYSETGRKRTEAAKLILQQDPDADTLAKMIDTNQLAEEAWDLLVKLSPTCEDLEWLIWRGNIKVNEAAALSLKNKPNKQQLFEIFANSNKKEEAAELLVEMDLEIPELTELVLYSSNQKAVDLLSEHVGFDRSKVNEEALFLEIKNKILNNPELLNVNHWHDRETHCFGGWAITLNEEGRQIEKQFSSEIAAALLLPHYKHLFFADRETVLNTLINIA